MTNQSEFYYGLPEELINNLVVQAEDLLRDEELGCHIVGIYPAGNRIYGIESGVEGILCLYIDTVESLINPLYKTNNPSGFKVYKVNEYLSPIIMVNLFDWIKWIFNNDEEAWKQHALLHVLPFVDIIYQDNSIDQILEIAMEYMKSCKFKKDINLKAGDAFNTLYGPNILFRRTETILSTTGEFFPNINKDWGNVFSIKNITEDKEIIELDKKLINFNFGGEKLNYFEQQKLYKWYVDKRNTEVKLASPNQKLIPELGKLMERIYRFQL